MNFFVTGGTGNSTSVYEVCRVAESILFHTTKISDSLIVEVNLTTRVNFYANMKKTEKALNWNLKVSLRSSIIKTLRSLDKI